MTAIAAAMCCGTAFEQQKKKETYRTGASVGQLCRARTMGKAMGHGPCGCVLYPLADSFPKSGIVSCAEQTNSRHSQRMIWGDRVAVQKQEKLVLEELALLLPVALNAA
ncbi:hypothetical protein H4S08_000460 [Coemansia sp. RSA 1365]|nr:hypothetical protein H4S08_000460 [Coemansia sp. RSA 1365]